MTTSHCCYPATNATTQSYDFPHPNIETGLNAFNSDLQQRYPNEEMYALGDYAKQEHLKLGRSVTFADEQPPEYNNSNNQPSMEEQKAELESAAATIAQMNSNCEGAEPNSDIMGAASLVGNVGDNYGVSLAGYRTGKYTPNEWHDNNYKKYYASFADRETAGKIIQESNNLATALEAQTNRKQDENTRKLTQRCHDIHFWKVELEREIKDVLDETDRLIKQKNRLETALYATEIPLHIATECLNNRQRRTCGDLVQDEVECALLKEVQIINNVQDLLRRTINEADKQIQANRDKKEDLEMDWSDKKEALEIEQKNTRLRNESTDKQFYQGSATLQQKMSNPQSWAQFTHDNICRAENERMASIQLRSLIDNILEDTSRDMREAADIVEATLQKRTHEVQEALSKLLNQLKQINDSIIAQEKNIEMLKKAIRDKEAPLKVAQTRLRDRGCFRPGMELCADDPQYGLMEEVAQIQSTIDQLVAKMNEAENNLKDLYDNRMSLEKEIAVKKNSLFIDREKCIAIRSRYPSVIRLQGYNH